MRYYDYLLCAEKHLKGCSSLLYSYKPDTIHDLHVWLELYYLSGYIVEGMTIYSAYKLYNWYPNSDIRSTWNPSFTQVTGLDFFYERKVGGNIIFPNRTVRSLSVQGHHFQDIAKTLLRIDPSFNDIPYIGMGYIDYDVELLIDNWSPKIRYNEFGRSFNPISILNQDVVNRLINTCYNIYAKHI